MKEITVLLSDCTDGPPQGSQLGTSFFNYLPESFNFKTQILQSGHLWATKYEWVCLFRVLGVWAYSSGLTQGKAHRSVSVYSDKAMGRSG